MTTSKRAKRHLHNEAMQLIVGCFGSLGFLAAMVPDVARGPIGVMLLVSGSITVLLFVIANVRWGKSIGRSILLALLPAIVSFCMLYGLIWYLTSYLASQPDLFKFSIAPAPSSP